MSVMREGMVSATNEPIYGTVKTPRLAIFGPLALIVCAILLWAETLRRVDLARMTDLGLISVLPPQVFLAFIVLTVSFCLVLRQRQLQVPVLLLHVGTMIFMLYGITNLIEEVPRFTHTWHKVGITETIMRTGQVDRMIDHNFNWPGFYILNAFLTGITGVQSPLIYAGWAPVAFNLLYLGPLVIILASGTNEPRLVWLGVWFFFLTNWIGQDYFSPQGLNYFFNLTILGILLKWFQGPSSASVPLWNWKVLQRFGWLSRLSRPLNKLSGGLVAPPGLESPITAGQRVGLITIVMALFMVVVASHQLTPLFVVGCVATLVIFNRCTARGLPILMVVLVATWMSYVTVPWLSGHLEKLTGDVGEVSTAVSANVTGRIQGSPDHVFVVNSRLVMTTAVWGLALSGGMRRLRHGYRDLTVAMLVVIPFPLLVMAPYGGEMLLRVYLFALPFTVFFVAALFYTSPNVGTSWWTTIGISVVSVALIFGFFFARYGNERMDYFTSEEVDAVHYLYQVAEPGSLLVAGAHNLPWRFQDYERYDYKAVVPEMVAGDVDAIARFMNQPGYPAAYLILSRSQKAYAEMFRGLSPEGWERLDQALTTSSQFELIYANDDAKIFVFVPNKESGGS